MTSGGTDQTDRKKKSARSLRKTKLSYIIQCGNNKSCINSIQLIPYKKKSALHIRLIEIAQRIKQTFFLHITTCLTLLSMFVRSVRNALLLGTAFMDEGRTTRHCYLAFALPGLATGIKLRNPPPPHPAPARCAEKKRPNII